MNNKFKKRLYWWVLFKLRLNRRLAHIALKFRLFGLEKKLQEEFNDIHEFLFEHNFNADRKEDCVEPKTGRYPWGT